LASGSLHRLLCAFAPLRERSFFSLHEALSVTPLHELSFYMRLREISFSAPGVTQKKNFFAQRRKGAKKISLGKAAELAGYSKLDFIERMKLENEAIFDYGEDEIAEAFADVAKLP
jgi:hypothetical protein